MEGFRNNFDSQLVEAAFKKSQEVLTRDEIKLEDFIDLYGAENVERDQKYINRREESFRQNRTPEEEQALKLATVFEAVVHEHGELSNWFGPHATTFKASRYDDIHSGVDSIVEFQEPRKPASYLALAIDVTYSSDLRDKFNKILSEIRSGKLAEIKYFMSEETGERGEKKMVPRIVIGAVPSTVQALAALWLEGDNKRLGSHPIQFQILEEAIMQCRAFAQYAERIGQHELAIRYENDLHILEQILAEKSKTLRDIGTRDTVCDDIREITANAANWK